MPLTILMKRNNTPGARPLPTDLFTNEVAFNTADATMFVRHTDGTIKQIAKIGATGPTGPTGPRGPTGAAGQPGAFIQGPVGSRGPAGLFQLVYNNPTFNRVIYNDAAAGGWNGSAPIQCVINGTSIGSTSTGLFALSCGPIPFGLLTIINNGSIIGMGGQGGGGGTFTGPGAPGGDGGPAINVDAGGVSIVNNGNIWGGGGGGGGGGGNSLDVDGNTFNFSNGGGGGGGAGVNVGPGGLGGAGVGANNGTAGTTAAGGSGGVGQLRPNFPSGSAGNGGAGGSLGAVGTAGATSATGEAGGTGGAPGFWIVNCQNLIAYSGAGSVLGSSDCH